MATKSVYGLCFIFLFYISVTLLFATIMCIICKVKSKPIFSNRLMYVAFMEGLAVFCFFKWSVAIFVWIALLICNICYVRYASDRQEPKPQDKKNDRSFRFTLKEIVSHSWFKVQISTLAFINLQLVFENIPHLNMQVLSGHLVLDYMLNSIGISGVLIVLYFILRPLFLHGRPQYSGWKTDYSVCFLLGAVLVHVVFALLYFVV